ncbi:hypothetical protein C8A01DRAFT_41774 [Parachaetomium inaequale]|uniref:Uncharacterized protein n=1 Tax=Parachaetomium inaequale TaxID=2588326 RepID=A0AAN6P4V2_9PEZI|nr:hypothetical protein C8A01DRAFT_41774 [Parachaetomium inaequale]
MTEGAHPDSSLETLRAENYDLRLENDRLTWDNTMLRKEVEELRAASLPRRSSHSTAADKSYMKPTTASRFRQAAVSRELNTHTEAWEPSTWNVSPPTKRHDGHTPGYMQPTAASHQKRGSQRAAVAQAQPKVRLQRPTKIRKSSRLDDSLWQTLRGRTEQPVAKIISRPPVAEQQPLTTGSESSPASPPVLADSTMTGTSPASSVLVW